MEKKKHLISKERQVNTYKEMWRVSLSTLNQAEKEERGSFFQLMASLVFTAFTLEAYLNHLGKQLFNCWDDLERISPRNKVNVISEKLGITKNDGTRPFQTLKQLFKFRDDVAHGKTVPLSINREILISETDFDEYMRKPLEADWEKYCTLKNAKRAREDVKQIMEKFHQVSGLTDESLFFPDHWSGSATLIK